MLLHDKRYHVTNVLYLVFYELSHDISHLFLN